MVCVQLRPEYLLAAASFALCGCSEVHRYTYELEYTTDREPHTVQLWYDEGRGKGEQLAYALIFPQSYYAYRDNHDGGKQTTIGLLLDRQTLGPLTELMATETGVIEPLGVPRWQEGDLKKLAADQYAHRQFLVTIRGRTLLQSRPRNISEFYGEMYKRVGKQGPFTVYTLKVQPRQPDRDLPSLTGFATNNPDIHFHCLSGVQRCSVAQPYRASTINISLGRADLDQAPTLMAGIRNLLDRHRVQFSS